MTKGAAQSVLTAPFSVVLQQFREVIERLNVICWIVQKKIFLLQSAHVHAILDIRNNFYKQDDFNCSRTNAHRSIL